MFWQRSHINPAWQKTREAWQSITGWLSDYGVLSADMLPSQTAPIPAAALFSKFPGAEKRLVFEWLLQTFRYQRYSGASHTAVEEDLREIDRASTLAEAIGGMRGRIRAIDEFTSDFFLRDYTEGRFGRLMLYLLAFKNGAVDWDETDRRIAFDGDKLVPGFEPQFHHVFPRKFLKGTVDDGSIEALANIAIIGSANNLKISAKDPLDYFEKYKIGIEKRAQQFIDGPVVSMTPENFPTWLQARADRLSNEANNFVRELRPSPR